MDTTDGSIKFVRTFEACQRSIIETRRRLPESEYRFLATKIMGSNWIRVLTEVLG